MVSLFLLHLIGLEKIELKFMILEEKKIMWIYLIEIEVKLIFCFFQMLLGLILLQPWILNVMMNFIVFMMVCSFFYFLFS
jgi:hypothetical protein